MSSRNLTAVEGLRFFLFLGIFVFHCVSRWFPIGWGGVQAFLVISSFFLTNKYLGVNQKDIAIGSLFKARIKRLYPVYLAIIVFSVLFSLITKIGNPFDAIWYVLSAQNFRCLFDGYWSSLDFLLGHFWYIALDVWLFLIWIVLLKIIPRERYRIAFIFALLIGIGWRTTMLLLFSNNISFSYVIPIGMLDSFALGGLVALNVRENGLKDGIMWIDLLIGIVGVLLLTIYNAHLHNCSYIESYQLFCSASGYMHNPLTGNTFFFIALFFAGVVRYCINTTKRHRFLSIAPLVFLGGLSYELFCFHFPIQYVVRHIINNELIVFITALLITCVVSFVWKKYVAQVINRILK